MTGSKYHGLRCTGGTLIATDNLIVANKNRGIYLGNKSASGRVSNNVIMGNGTGVGAFAQSDVTIENNLILDSSYAGLGSRDSCRLKIRNNLFAGNTRGIVVFEDIGKTQLDLGRNSFWDNKTTTENFELPKTAILADPRLAGAIEGNFVTQAEEHTSHHQGLTNAKVIQALCKVGRNLIGSSLANRVVRTLWIIITTQRN